jgi:hypothetical protein
MKKIVVLLAGFSLCVLMSCSSAPAKKISERSNERRGSSLQHTQNISPIIQISVSDLNLLDFWEWEIPDSIQDFTDGYIKAIAFVYIIRTSPEEGTVIIADEADTSTSMADQLKGKHAHWANYSENIERRYDKNKKYRMELTLDIYKVAGRKYGLTSVEIDSIDGLISVEELAELDLKATEEKRMREEAEASTKEQEALAQQAREKALEEEKLQKELEKERLYLADLAIRKLDSIELWNGFHTYMNKDEAITFAKEKFALTGQIGESRSGRESMSCPR